MISYAEGGKTAPVTLIKQWKERQGLGREDSLQGVPTVKKSANAQKNAKTPTQPLEHKVFWCMRISNRPLTAQVTLLVANSVKLHAKTNNKELCHVS